MHTRHIYELIDPERNHNKEWSIQGPIDSATVWRVVCRWGRIGTTKQSKEWLFGSESKAREFIRRKQEEKEREGYTLREEATIDKNGNVDTHVVVTRRSFSAATVQTTVTVTKPRAPRFDPDDESMFEVE